MPLAPPPPPRAGRARPQVTSESKGARWTLRVLYIYIHYRRVIIRSARVPARPCRACGPLRVVWRPLERPSAPQPARARRRNSHVRRGNCHRRLQGALGCGARPLSLRAGDAQRGLWHKTCVSGGGRDTDTRRARDGGKRARAAGFGFGIERVGRRGGDVRAWATLLRHPRRLSASYGMLHAALRLRGG